MPDNNRETRRMLAERVVQMKHPDDIIEEYKQYLYSCWDDDDELFNDDWDLYEGDK